jgi:hypothetical protein
VRVAALRGLQSFGGEGGSNGTTPATYTATAGSLTITWTMDAAADTVDLALSGPTDLWSGISFNDAARMGGDAIFLQPAASGDSRVVCTALGSRDQGSTKTCGALNGIAISDVGGSLTAVFTRPLAGGGPGAMPIASSGSTIVVWAHGGSGEGFIGRHANSDAGAVGIDFSTGAVKRLAVGLDIVLAAHALLAFLAFGCLMPGGVIVARYFKASEPTT